MSTPLLEARSVVRDFTSHPSLGHAPSVTTRALDGVSLRANRGEVLALLGKNGAGKTTFLRLAFGLIRPTGGDMLICDKSAQKSEAAGGNRVAGVGENWEPPRWASLDMLAYLQAGAGRFDRAAFNRWCGRREFRPHKTWGPLSKGQKRWVLCGLALAREPEVLLLDEPADGLDPAARKELFTELRSYATRRDAAVIVTTHILADVERAADRVAILDRGRLVLEGYLDTLREQVREVECDQPIDLQMLVGDLQILGSRLERDRTLYWVRSTNREVLAALAEGYRTRGISLDELFTLITERPRTARHTMREIEP